jgi:hypothetical protein
VGDKSGPLPRRKLAPMQVEDPNYVLTAISGHVGVSVGTILQVRPADSYWSMPSKLKPINPYLHQTHHIAVDNLYQNGFVGKTTTSYSRNIATS